MIAISLNFSLLHHYNRCVNIINKSANDTRALTSIRVGQYADGGEYQVPKTQRYIVYNELSLGHYAVK